MSKVTSKLQITVPQRVAERYGIRPGDEIEWVPAGDCVRIIPVGRLKAATSAKGRLELFDQATERQRAREAESPGPTSRGEGRGPTRDELDDRG